MISISISAAVLSHPVAAPLGQWLVADGSTPTPSPTEVLRPGLDKWDVTPGLIGFLAMFCVVLAAVAVWFSMSGKLRKIQHDERMQASGEQARAESEDEATAQQSVVREKPTQAKGPGVTLSPDAAVTSEPDEA